MKSNLVIMQISLFYMLLSFILILGCTGGKKSTQVLNATTKELMSDTTLMGEEKEAKNNSKAHLASDNFEVNGCHVKATIISIIPQPNETNIGGPCAENPCIALIRIDKVIKMGSQCGPFVVPGAELKAFFKFTLSKTDNLFPDMKQHFPGLEINDKFAASFDAISETIQNGHQIVIYDYNKAK